MNSKWKVFIMTVIGFLVTTLSTLQDFNFAYVAIVTVIFAVTYWLKNVFMPTGVNVPYWKDILSGVILAVCMAGSTLAANIITGEPFTWKALWIAVSGAVVGYFGKNVTTGQVTKSRMKKVAGVVILLLAIGVANAQSPFKGFFKPSDELVKVSVRAEGDYSQWLIRPYVSLVASTIDLSEKPVLVGSLNAIGMGVSYGKYRLVNDKAFCSFSVNANLLTQVNLNGVVDAKIGPAVTVGVFDNLLNAGVGYLDKKFLLLLGIAYTF